MAGTGRLFFTESEKICLKELILKYKLNSAATTMGSTAAKKAAWARLTEEYNAIETNSKRTAAQLKKCWDNLKTRHKSVLAHEKRERMRTGGGSAFLPSTSQENILEDALTEQTDVELLEVIDSDYVPSISGTQTEVLLSNTTSDNNTHILNYETVTDEDTHQNPDAISESTNTEILNESATERDHNTSYRISESRLTDYGVAPSQRSRNVRTHVIQEEFSIRQRSYERAQKREDELHKLQVSEKELMVKAAQENYLKSKAEREAAQELLLCNKAKREEAELRLGLFKDKKK